MYHAGSGNVEANWLGVQQSTDGGNAARRHCPRLPYVGRGDPRHVRGRSALTRRRRGHSRRLWSRLVQSGGYLRDRRVLSCLPCGRRLSAESTFFADSLRMGNETQKIFWFRFAISEQLLLFSVVINWKMKCPRGFVIINSLGRDKTPISRGTGEKENLSLESRL